MITEAEKKGEFEQTLLSYTEMCYSVALVLTRNPADARCLTREVLVDAWHLNGNSYDKKNIKTRLLTSLRIKFKANYCQSKYIVDGSTQQLRSGSKDILPNIQIGISS